MYYGHLGTSQECPDYQGVLIFQVSLHNNVRIIWDHNYVGVWIMQVSTFSSVLINRFHSISILFLHVHTAIASHVEFYGGVCPPTLEKSSPWHLRICSFTKHIVPSMYQAEVV